MTAAKYLCKKYHYTGQDQFFDIPQDTLHFKVKLWGAGGGREIYGSLDHYHTAGVGGFTMAKFAVAFPTLRIRVMVGQGGFNSDSFYASDNKYLYGFGAVSLGDSGGGLTGIFMNTADEPIKETSLDSALAIAGGGASYDVLSSGVKDEQLGESGGNGNSPTSGGAPTMRGETEPFNGMYNSGGGGYSGGRLGSTSGIATGGKGFVAAIAQASKILFTPDGNGRYPPMTDDPDYERGVGVKGCIDGAGDGSNQGCEGNPRLTGGHGLAVICAAVKCHDPTVAKFKMEIGDRCQPEICSKIHRFDPDDPTAEGCIPCEDDTVAEFDPNGINECRVLRCRPGYVMVDKPAEGNLSVSLCTECHDPSVELWRLDVVNVCEVLRCKPAHRPNIARDSCVPCEHATVAKFNVQEYDCVVEVCVSVHVPLPGALDRCTPCVDATVLQFREDIQGCEPEVCINAFRLSQGENNITQCEPCADVTVLEFDQTKSGCVAKTCATAYFLNATTAACEPCRDPTVLTYKEGMGCAVRQCQPAHHLMVGRNDTCAVCVDPTVKSFYPEAHGCVVESCVDGHTTLSSAAGDQNVSDPGLSGGSGYAVNPIAAPGYTETNNVMVDLTNTAPPSVLTVCRPCNISFVTAYVSGSQNCTVASCEVNHAVDEEAKSCVPVQIEIFTLPAEVLTAATLASLVSGNPCAAMSAQRLGSLARECESEINMEPRFDVAPVKLPIGNSFARYYTGGIVFALALAICIPLLHLLGALVYAHACREKQYLRTIQIGKVTLTVMLMFVIVAEPLGHLTIVSSTQGNLLDKGVGVASLTVYIISAFVICYMVLIKYFIARLQWIDVHALVRRQLWLYVVERYMLPRAHWKVNDITVENIASSSDPNIISNTNNDISKESKDNFENALQPNSSSQQTAPLLGPRISSSLRSTVSIAMDSKFNGEEAESGSALPSPSTWSKQQQQQQPACAMSDSATLAMSLGAPLFNEFSDRFRFWLVVDASIALGLGMLEGLVPVIGCVASVAVVAALLCIHAIGVLVTRPFLTPSDKILNMIISPLMAVAGLLKLTFVLNERSSLADAMEVVIIVLSMLMLLRSVADLLQLCRKIFYLCCPDNDDSKTSAKRHTTTFLDKAEDLQVIDNDDISASVSRSGSMTPTLLPLADASL